jgi:parvulin-like peptidyl-prolyl isomerase
MAALLCAGALASCARDEPVLVVNGWALSRADFLAELDQIAHNQPYLDARAGAGRPLQIFKAGSTTEYAPDFVVEFLNERVTFQLAAAELAQRKLTITAEDRAAAITVINDGLATAGVSTPPGSVPGTSPPLGTVAGAPTPLDGFGSYRDILITGVASLQVLQRSLSAAITTDDQLRTLYEQLKEKYAEQTCARHLLVRAGDGKVDAQTGSPIVPTDLEYASALSTIVTLQGELAGGADFAELAQRRSDDPATKAQGGDLGCAPRGHYEAAFDAAVWSQPVGQVGDPVKSTYGYHLILVTERRTRSFEEVKDVLRQGVEAQGEQALQEWLATHSRDAAVIVDPGVGRWNATTGVIEPPPGSSTLTLVPDDQTTTPGSVPGTSVPGPLVPAGR